jgi:hypothetical protein
MRLATTDVPGATSFPIVAINDRGEVAGGYSSPLPNAHSHGFVYDDGTFTTIDPPGADFTERAAINDRCEVAGNYIAPASGGGLSISQASSIMAAPSLPSTRPLPPPLG